MWDLDQCIVAIASPTTPAARGIVRLTGEGAVELVDSLVKGQSDDAVACQKRGAPSRTTRTITLPSPWHSLQCTILRWHSKRSYTGQPSAEIHTFGCIPLLEAVVDELVKAGARPARPGEFTMRAFFAGRLDLTQAEAVLGVIDAEERGALDHALQQLAGNLSRPLESARESVLCLLADVEAGLDFVDEDIEFISQNDLVRRTQDVLQQMVDVEKVMRLRRGSSDRISIVFCGEPNAGKSRLLNELVGRDVALVADLVGTTRDLVTCDDELNGVPVRWIDTAGDESQIGRTDGPDARIRHDAQAMMHRAVRDADILIDCVPAGKIAAGPDSFEGKAGDSSRRSQIHLRVLTKSDLGSAGFPSPPTLRTSAATGEGIDQLREEISEHLAQRDREQSGGVVGTATRCRGTIKSAIEHLQLAIVQTESGLGSEFVATELRLAAESIGEVTGAVYTDDVLDRVFSRFCIGK